MDAGCHERPGPSIGALNLCMVLTVDGQLSPGLGGIAMEREGWQYLGRLCRDRLKTLLLVFWCRLVELVVDGKCLL